MGDKGGSIAPPRASLFVPFVVDFLRESGLINDDSETIFLLIDEPLSHTEDDRIELEVALECTEMWLVVLFSCGTVAGVFVVFLDLGVLGGLGSSLMRGLGALGGARSPMLKKATGERGRAVLGRGEDGVRGVEVREV